ncbi:LPXTG cell wall anchor domain-containing protein [Listeria sp. FSL L7-1582]|uniref:LPXTG cell wall anchor domain-containing protein n=1 Tax=Listeria portnoyi TaxID=2713504 RepID=UPI00164E17CB|nr:LPXTG cell wall anchor domain-containing protein [Listeria portnoyi]MBC6310875.1 LPXTG cell wall anchor domain-containing protein [Listeria portnoyi]
MTSTKVIELENLIDKASNLYELNVEAAAVKSPEKVGQLPETGDESSSKWPAFVGLFAILGSVAVLYRKNKV